eukprot:COSAG02_NODE_2371_length_9032_cov_26.076122_3_plen_73_part_00
MNSMSPYNVCNEREAHLLEHAHVQIVRQRTDRRSDTRHVGTQNSLPGCRLRTQRGDAAASPRRAAAARIARS